MSDRKKVRIAFAPADEKPMESVRVMLDQLGFEVSVVPVAPESGSLDSSPPMNGDVPTPVLAVLVTPGALINPAIEQVIERAKVAGGRIVGIFAPGVTSGELPEGLKRHGDSALGWNADHLVDGLTGERDIWCQPGPEGTWPASDVKWLLERFNCPEPD